MIVVKLGGASGIDPAPLVRDLKDRNATAASRQAFVLLHGASEATSDLQRALGSTPRFVTGPTGRSSRVTDEAALRAFTLACAERNAALVLALRAEGLDAVGLSGLDGGVLRATRKRAVRYVEDGRTMLLRGDRSGTVDSADAGLLQMLVAAGRVPVLSPPALAEDGSAVNVDADRAAAVVSVALGAQALVLLSNVPGLLKDPRDPHSRIEQVDLNDADAAREAEACAGGRMGAKWAAARYAASHGVAQAVIADARREAPLSRALRGSGTVIARPVRTGAQAPQPTRIRRQP